METATRERPMVFSGPEVRVILDGRKTQTRRVIKHQGDFLGAGGRHGGDWDDPNLWGWEDPENPSHFIVLGRTPEPGDVPVCCPYGTPGDRLWVQETYWTDWREPGVTVYDATPEWGKYRSNGEVVRSTHPDESLTTREEARAAMLPKFWRRRSSTTMPRWASRLTLRVESVRVERLQEISDDDAVMELGAWRRGEEDEAFDTTITTDDPRRDFILLWDHVNAKRGFPWESNPWLWVVAFAVESRSQ